MPHRWSPQPAERLVHAVHMVWVRVAVVAAGWGSAADLAPRAAPWVGAAIVTAAAVTFVHRWRRLGVTIECADDRSDRVTVVNPIATYRFRLDDVVGVATYARSRGHTEPGVAVHVRERGLVAASVAAAPDLVARLDRRGAAAGAGPGGLPHLGQTEVLARSALRLVRAPWAWLRTRVRV